MLKKVLKYDIKYFIKYLGPFYLILTLVAVFSKGMSFLADKYWVFNILSGILMFAYILLALGSFVYLFIISIRRFDHSIYKNEGYLTNTLPVKRSNILNSKIIVSTLFMIISTLIVMISLWIVFYNQGLWNGTVASFKGFAATFNCPVWLMLVVLTFLTVISYLNSLLLVLASYTLGHTKNSNKKAYSIIYGIIIYTLSQIFSMIVLVPLIFINGQEIITLSDTLIRNTFYQIMALGTLSTLILNGVYYLIIKTTYQKKFNIE